jgi:DNA-binding NtrC family response regulator
MGKASVSALETILVVDDTEIVLRAAVGILEAANFDVLQARSGTQALKLAADNNGEIHLLLSDIRCQKCPDRNWLNY